MHLTILNHAVNSEHRLPKEFGLLDNYNLRGSGTWVCIAHRHMLMAVCITVLSLFPLIGVAEDKPKEVKQLIDAAYDGNLDQVKSLLDSGVDPNGKFYGGDTALMAAVKKGHKKVAELLLERGADVNSRDEERESALIWAVAQGPRESTIEMVKLLLDHGARIEATDLQGYSALKIAVGRGELDVAKLLIDRGARVNSWLDLGDPPLARAVSGNEMEAVKFLLDHGADADYSAMKMAAIMGRVEIAKLLIDRGARVNTWWWNPDDPLLIHAVSHNRIEAAKLLLDHGADINAKSWSGDTALKTALKQRRKEMELLLRSRGAKEQ